MKTFQKWLIGGISLMTTFVVAVMLGGATASAATTYATVTGYAPHSSSANQPSYWCATGTKVSPGGKTYVLPVGTYTKVIVKAGANQSGNFANTIFAAPPKAGQTVWADTNGNGVFDPDGPGGDKGISHVILCKGTTTSATPTPASTSATPTPTTTSATPTPTETTTVTSTPTPTPTTTSATPTPTDTPTDGGSVPPSKTATPPPPELPKTGSSGSTSLMAGLGALLLLGGAATMWATRKRGAHS